MPVEQLLGLGAQRRRDAAVQLHAQREEVLGVARLEHVELQLHLAVLGAQQLPQHGVLDVAEVDGRQLGAYDVGVGLELAVGEVGIGVAPLEEAVAQVVGVDRA